MSVNEFYHRDITVVPFHPNAVDSSDIEFNATVASLEQYKEEHIEKIKLRTESLAANMLVITVLIYFCFSFVGLFQDLIRGNAIRSVEDAAIVAPVIEDEAVEDRPEKVKANSRPPGRKLPEHDLSNIMPTGKRRRKSITTSEALLVAPVAPKPRGLPKEKKSARDKELEKSDRRLEIAVYLILFCLHLAVD